MREYLLFALQRLALLAAVVFFGIFGAFFISHLSPINPVESIIGEIASRATISPAAVEDMRRSLNEMFGLDVPLWQQYLNFWSRLLVGDLGEHPYSRLLKASVLSVEDAGHGKLAPAAELAATSDALVGRSVSRLEPRGDGRQVRVYPAA